MVFRSLPPLFHNTYDNTVCLEPSIPDRSSNSDLIFHTTSPSTILFWPTGSFGTACGPHGAVALRQRGLHRQCSDRRCPVRAKNISSVSICASVAMVGIDDRFYSGLLRESPVRRAHDIPCRTAHTNIAWPSPPSKRTSPFRGRAGLSPRRFLPAHRGPPHVYTTYAPA